MARYTADEMREAANAVDEVSIDDNGEYFYEKDDKFNPFLVRDMLRQAADLQEREEKREKKFEYACFGRVFQTLNGARVYAIANEFQGRRPTIVRRECGKWEEVADEE